MATTGMRCATVVDPRFHMVRPQRLLRHCVVIRSRSIQRAPIVSAHLESFSGDQQVDSSSRLKVAVLGAGIGGLAVAVALHRRGADVQVYERAQELRQDVGTGLALWPNGMKALGAMGLDIEEAVKLKGCVIQGMAISSGGNCVDLADGSFRAKALDRARKVPGGLLAKSYQLRHGAPLVCIRWAALQKVLYSFLPPEKVHLDRAFSRSELLGEDAGVRAHFVSQRGEESSVEADVLIGADGIRSALRQQLLGDGPPMDGGRMTWRSVIDDGDSAQGRKYICPSGFTTIMFSANDEGRTATFMDVGGGALYWAAGALDGQYPDLETAGSAWEQCRLAMAQYPDVLACLDATPPSKVYASRILDRPPLFESAWEGAVTLCGDAAHAVTPSFGQGANLALEDAWEMAQALSQPGARARPAQALRRWEAMRLERTSQIQIGSFLQGAKSYGDAKLSAAKSLVPDQVLEAHMERFKTRSSMDTFLHSWKPSNPYL